LGSDFWIAAIAFAAGSSSEELTSQTCVI